MSKHTSSRGRSVGFQELLSAAPPGESGRRRPRLLRTATLAVASVLVGAVAFSAASLPPTLVAAGTTEELMDWWDGLPSTLDAVELPQHTELLDREGREFARLYTENRVVLPLEKMGETAPQALLAVEDARFYEHSGLDAKGLSRALVNNLFSDSTQGASTLTQQLVENMRAYAATTEEERVAAKAQSATEKLAELRYSTGIEAASSKDDILEAYLNIVYFGNGAYGIEAAAQRYFSVPAAKLTVPQAATLVAMLKSPTAYDPLSHPQASRQRRDVVMKRMVAEGYLTEARYREFSSRKTRLKPSQPKRGCGASEFPFYCQLVLDSILEDSTYGESRGEREKLLAVGGLRITTALDRRAMGQAQAAVDRALGRENRVAAGLAMIQPGTGHVLAISQNRDWGSPSEGSFAKTQIVYPNSASFQTGSTFKPITAAAALEEGYSARALLAAGNGVYFDGLDAPPGGFKNDSRSGYGSIDMYAAMKRSVNTYFVNLTSQVGVKDVAAMARRLGMKSTPSDLTGREGSITLGAYEASPLELASVYATFASRGIACDPVTVLAMEKKATGEELRVADGDCRQELSPAVADTISSVLEAPFEAGGTAARLPLDRRATGKTGTTNGAAATWFSGYTPQVATSVWIGDPRGGQTYPLQGVSAYGAYHSTVYGGTIAGPIWQETMLNFHKGLPKKWYPKPGGVSASMASRTVPSTVGIDVHAAVTLLLEAGFRVKLAKKPASLPHVAAPNVVAAQTPEAGGKAAHGDTITLRLTEGSATAMRVPEDYDELQEWAREAQASAGGGGR